LPVWQQQPLLVLVRRLSAQPVFSPLASSLQQVLLLAWRPVWQLRFWQLAWRLVLLLAWRLLWRQPV
jgi:hypothetical protein